MSDEEKILDGFGRYLQTSKAVVGLLTRAAGEKYLGISWDQASHAQQLREVLSQLKGPAMKIGQILATVPDMVPESYFQEFLQLQSSAPPMGWGFVRRRMRSELGERWESRFAQFEREASAAASLGQVHRATSLEGLSLACKLQYPAMRDTLETDLKQLRFVCQVYERTGGGIWTQEIQEEIRERLFEELDYQQEARNLNRFRSMLANEAGVQIPQVIPSLSTSQLLTMTWLEGEPFLNARESPPPVREWLAEKLFRAWYKPFYHYGLLHADPHLGNYTVQLGKDPCLNLLDFGCVRVFPPSFVKGVLDLYQGLLTDDPDLRAHAYETWGFKDLNQELLDALNQWALFLYGPLLDDRIRPIEETFSGNPGREIASNVHETLRKQGGISPPRCFVFMDRAAVGIGSAFIHLRVSLNWHRLFQELIEGFSMSQLEARQQHLLEEDQVLK
jgi:predicted unusual protein kinase regulating ubiquinone biosynthesis (AarF/ABC1/UbiB family)